MGQYYRIYNTSKKEYITASKFGEGVKLTEFGCDAATTMGLVLLLANSNGRGGGDIYIIGVASGEPGKADAQLDVDAASGRWAGDRVVVQGDYAIKGDPAYISQKRLASFTDISDIVIAALRHDHYINSKLPPK